MSLLILILIFSFINVILSQFLTDFMSFDDPFFNPEPKSVRSDTDEGYRLPTCLDPVHYDVELTPYFEPENDKQAFTFDGVVRIIVKVSEEGISQLVIHEQVTAILGVTVIDSNGQPLKLNATVPFERDTKYNFLKINLEGNTLANQAVYNITVEYTGNMTEKDGGLLRGNYKDYNGNVHWYATTGLEPTYSRLVFPCFDEPNFKATFNIIINRPVKFSSSYSNSKLEKEIPNGNRVKEIFYKTPKMASYLVSLHISEDFKVVGNNNNATHPFQVIARPNAVGQSDLALEIGPKAISWFSEYLGVDSYTMGENLNENHIAVPGYTTGALESWGSIHYSEMRLLYGDGRYAKQNQARTIVHEIAHKWFGNLVTCRWWSNLWLNEGFASFFADLALHEMDSSMDKIMIVSMVLTALAVDSNERTQPMQRKVNSPDEVQSTFDAVTYYKGGAVLSMLRYLVTDTTFRSALNTYLTDNAYEYVEPKNLYNAFESAVQAQGPLPSNISIETFMKTWVEEPGYPVVDVKFHTETGLITLFQERFFSNATAKQTKQVWPIPLTFTTGSSPDWDNLTPSHVMTERSMKIQGTPGKHWVIFNLQQKGLYRVNYDTCSWQNIISALKKNPNNIHHLNRAQIVCDVFAFMVSKRITFGFGFQILDFLKQETNFYVWQTALEGFKILFNEYFYLSNLQNEYERIVLTFMETVIAEVGFDVAENEPFLQSVKRNQILKGACAFGHEGCIQDAVAKFSALRTTGVSVSADLRGHVYCTGVHVGDYEDWKFLEQLRENTNNRFDSYYYIFFGLMCSKNRQALQEHLENMLKLERFKFEHSASFIVYPILNDYINAFGVLQFIKQRIEDIRTSGFEIGSLFSLLARNLKEEELNDMEQWLCDNEASIPEYNIGIKAITAARAKLKRVCRDANTIIAAARGAGTHGSPSVSSVLKSFISSGVSFLTKVYNDIPNL